MSKPDLFICHTAYQVLVDLCRAMNAPQKPDLILSSAVANAAPLSARLAAAQQFGQIFIFDERLCGNPKVRGPFGTFLLGHTLGRRHVERHYSFRIDPARYRTVYIHNDWSVLGRYLQDKGIPYVLCEDTLASTCRAQHPLIKEQRSLPHFKLRQALGYDHLYWGDWKGVFAVETECAAKTDLFPEKRIEHSKQALFESLTEPQKALIRQVFITQPLPAAAQNAILFLPRDFVADGLLDEATQQRMFVAVAASHCKDGPLFIKTHPRDETDYSALFPKAVILDRTMPSEVLNFALPFRFIKAVTVESTVLSGLLVVDEKLELSLQEALSLL